MPEHLVQSPEWGKFKTEYNTEAIRVGSIQFTKHKIPFTDYYYGYCPKVDPTEINFKRLKKVAKENSCLTINFDVPNVLKNSDREQKALEIFTENKCRKSPKNTFAKHNVTLDLTKSEKELLNNMHKKHKYNIGYAQRKGLITKMAANQGDFDIFYKLFSTTSERQKYYIHPKSYYQKIWDIFRPIKLCHILTVEYESEPLASWMLFTYKKVLYYPYGGSSTKHRNLHAGCLIGWEAIKLGKKTGCRVFDMWGAAKDPFDKTGPWFGFTNFKMKFGGEHVEYMDSYDLVLNEPAYRLFNIANDIRWKVLNLIKGGSTG